MKSKKQKNALHNFLKPEEIFLSLVLSDQRSKT